MQILAIDRAMTTEHFVTVASENQKASLDLTASLLTPAIGHIALITALPELTISQSEKAGFEQAIASHSATRHLCEGAHFSRTEGYRLIKTLHQQLGQLPEALITTSYILMEGCSTTCWSRRPT